MTYTNLFNFFMPTYRIEKDWEDCDDPLREKLQRGDNTRKNKEFRDATKGLDKDTKRRIHDTISGGNDTYTDIKELLQSF